MQRAQTIRIRAKQAISAGFFCSIYTSNGLYGTYTKFIGFTKILGKLNKLDKLVFMDRRNNPYAPGAGLQPPELAGRDRLLKDAKIDMDRLLGKRPRLNTTPMDALRARIT
jgi:hypothetical protein